MILTLSFFIFCTGGETVNNNNMDNEGIVSLDEMNEDDLVNYFIGTWSWSSEDAELGIIIFNMDDEGNLTFSIENEIFGQWSIMKDDEGEFWLTLMYEDGTEELMQVTMDDEGTLILIDEAETMIDMIPVEEEEDIDEVTLEQIESYIVGTWVWNEEMEGEIMFKAEEAAKIFFFYGPEDELTGEWEVLEETGTGYYLYLYFEDGTEGIYLIILNDDGTISLFDEDGEEIILYPVE
jgi:hypothetical protein